MIFLPPDPQNLLEKRKLSRFSLFIFGWTSFVSTMYLNEVLLYLTFHKLWCWHCSDALMLIDPYKKVFMRISHVARLNGWCLRLRKLYDRMYPTLYPKGVHGVHVSLYPTFHILWRQYTDATDQGLSGKYEDEII